MDPGPCCLFTFYVLFCYSFCVTFVSVLGLCNLDGVLVFALYVLCIVSHARAAFTDPGSNSSDVDVSSIIRDAGEGGIILRCPKCCSIKPLRTHHCRVCRRCILKMDHHCPWINNCVGLYNQKFFFLFTLYLTLLSGCLSVIIIYRFIYKLSSESNHNIFSPLIRHHLDIFLLLIITTSSLVFGLVMFSRQLWSIHNNITTIEHKKNELIPDACQNMDNYLEVFGSKSFCSWISPFHAPRVSIKETSCSKYVRMS